MTTPSARVILPAEATGEMLKAARKHLPGGHGQVWVYLPEAYESMLAASPNAGKVTEAELEKAFTKFHDAQHIDGLSEAEAFRAALSAIGLEVE